MRIPLLQQYCAVLYQICFASCTVLLYCTSGTTVLRMPVVLYILLCCTGCTMPVVLYRTSCINTVRHCCTAVCYCAALLYGTVLCCTTAVRIHQVGDFGYTGESCRVVLYYCTALLYCMLLCCTAVRRGIVLYYCVLHCCTARYCYCTNG